ncbi:MAG: Ku protein [Proteobacteria bacterium]|nr:Ku protein [Pseudomonadota bacterium]
MAIRPYWSGQIRLSLVSLPVSIYAALSRSRQIPLHEIYRPTGQRVRHQNVVDGEPIDREDIVKGYEVEKGEYVLIEPEEIAAIKIPSKKILEITQFIDKAAIDQVYFEAPYFVTPDGKGAEDAFIVIREALRASGKVGLGQLAIAGRERLCTIKPCGSGIMLETLRYEDEIRESDPYFDDIPDVTVDKEQLSLAKELIRRKTAPFRPEKFHDHYREALQELINAKLEDREPRDIIEEKPAGKVINLMDALRKSLKDSGETKRKTTAKLKAKPKAKTPPKPRPKPTGKKPDRKVKHGRVA